MSQITEQIKNRVDIAELVREYVPELKKAGQNWKARCPFHQEKTPSFTVSQDKGFYHCFGCGEGGDIFDFIQKIEGVEFSEALALLAKRAGVTLEAYDKKEVSERERMFELQKQAVRWYHAALLKAKSGDHARAYIEQRGMSEHTRDAWQIGFAPDSWEGLLQYLRSRGYKDAQIARVGLAVANDRGGYYDRFRNRLLFPIEDVHGNVVGFTGRKLNDEDVGGKYINTPETPLYHKSEVLFGLSKAKKAIREADAAVVVEGNMDCISSHQAGVCNTVAASGTALTPEHIQLLKRYTKNVYLAFDPDSAGQQALMRGLELAWQEDMNINVIALPEGKDPDDLIREDVAAWKQCLKEALAFMDWVMRRAKAQFDLTAALGKKQAARFVLPWIARLPDPVEQTHYLQELSRVIRVDEQILRGILKRAHRPAGRPTPARATDAPMQAKTEDDQIAKQALVLAVASAAPKEFFAQCREEWMAQSVLYGLYKSLKIFYDSHTGIPDTSWVVTLEKPQHAHARDILLKAEEALSSLSSEDIQNERVKLIERLRVRHIKRELERVRRLIEQAEREGDSALINEYTSVWHALSKDIKRN